MGFIYINIYIFMYMYIYNGFSALHCEPKHINL